jgi:hypothetical protein
MKTAARLSILLFLFLATTASAQWVNVAGSVRYSEGWVNVAGVLDDFVQISKLEVVLPTVTWDESRSVRTVTYADNSVSVRTGSTTSDPVWNLELHPTFTGLCDSIARLKVIKNDEEYFITDMPGMQHLVAISDESGEAGWGPILRRADADHNHVVTAYELSLLRPPPALPEEPAVIAEASVPPSDPGKTMLCKAIDVIRCGDCEASMVVRCKGYDTDAQIRDEIVPLAVHFKVLQAGGLLPRSLKLNAPKKDVRSYFGIFPDDDEIRQALIAKGIQAGPKDELVMKSFRVPASTELFFDTHATLPATTSSGRGSFN